MVMVSEPILLRVLLLVRRAVVRLYPFKLKVPAEIVVVEMVEFAGRVKTPPAPLIFKVPVVCVQLLIARELEVA
jgi:hypothetical protein